MFENYLDKMAKQSVKPLPVKPLPVKPLPTIRPAFNGLGDLSAGSNIQQDTVSTQAVPPTPRARVWDNGPSLQADESRGFIGSLIPNAYDLRQKSIGQYKSGDVLGSLETSAKVLAVGAGEALTIPLRFATSRIAKTVMDLPGMSKTFTPTTPQEKFVFGPDTMKSSGTELAEGYQGGSELGEKAGINKYVAGGAGMGLATAMGALDLAGVGGEEKAGMETLLEEAKKFESADEFVKATGGAADLWHQAQGEAHAFKQPEVFEGLSDLSTKTLEKLKGRTTVSKQFLVDTLKQQGIKTAERDALQSVLATMPEDKISVAEFANKVKQELLPLTASDSIKWADYSLPSYLRDPGADYNVHVYESPIPTDAGGTHFSKEKFPNYFGHVRYEDVGDTRRVLEVQSDLTQSRATKYIGKGEIANGEMDEEAKAELLGRYKDVPPINPDAEGNFVNYPGVEAKYNNKDYIFQGVTTDYKDGQKLSKVLLEPKNGITEKIPFAEFEKQNPDLMAKVYKQAADKEAQTAKLRPYAKDSAGHFRMIREEVKNAAQAGKNQILFPTGDTAAHIERYVDAEAQDFDPGDYSVGDGFSDEMMGDSGIVVSVGHDYLNYVPDNKVTNRFSVSDFRYDESDNILGEPDLAASAIINNPAEAKAEIERVLTRNGYNVPIFKDPKKVLTPKQFEEYKKIPGALTDSDWSQASPPKVGDTWRPKGAMCDYEVLGVGDNGIFRAINTGPKKELDNAVLGERDGVTTIESKDSGLLERLPEKLSDEEAQKKLAIWKKNSLESSAKDFSYVVRTPEESAALDKWKIKIQKKVQTEQTKAIKAFHTAIDERDEGTLTDLVDNYFNGDWSNFDGTIKAHLDDIMGDTADSVAKYIKDNGYYEDALVIDYDNVAVFNKPLNEITQTAEGRIDDGFKDNVRDELDSGQQSVYDRYDKDIPKYIKNQYGLEPEKVTDHQGVTWFRLPLNESHAKNPVEAFGLIPAGVGAGALASKKDKKTAK